MEAWEVKARKNEVRYQGLAAAVGVIVAIAGVATAYAAVRAAQSAAEAVSTAQDAVLRGSRETRLSSGITAMGGESSAQRIAGISLLTRSVETELFRVGSDTGAPDDAAARDRRAARDAYTSTLDALEIYVGAWRPEEPDPRDEAARPSASPSASPSPPSLATLAGYAPPKDLYYAANELTSLARPEVVELARAVGAEPRLDLSFARLFGASLSAVDVSAAARVYLRGIDLRLANLSDTRWGTAALPEARLACAELSRASFAPGASLAGADLRGARLVGADLRGVDLRGARLEAADLSDAQLAGARLAGADVSGAVLPTDGLDGALGVELAVAASDTGLLRADVATPVDCLRAYAEPAAE